MPDLPLTTYQLDVPSVYQIEVTAACNFKCPFCPRGMSSEHITIDLFKRIVDRDLDGTQYVELQHRGEPLLHPAFGELIRYIKDKRKVAVGLSTNGSFLLRRASALYSYCDLLTISVDSVDPEKYEKLRVGGTLEDLLHQIEKFLAQKPSWLAVDLQVIDFPNQPSELPALRDLVERRGWIDKVRLRSVPESFEPHPHHHPPRKPADLCLNPWLSVSIESNGNVIPCCIMFSEEYVYGNVNEQSLREIWSGERVARFREMHVEDALTGTICDTCRMRSPAMLHTKMLRETFQLAKRTS